MPKGAKMPSVMPSQHSFAMVPKVTIERSVFDRSHAYKTTFDAGYLIPVFWDLILPGDTAAVKMHALARLSTPLKPIMDNMYLESFFFFVPFRLVWTNFVKFMGEQVNPGDSISYVMPQATVPAAGYSVGTVEDYFGIPTGVPATAGSWTHSALLLRSYQLIYNQWFRDENLQTSAAISLGDGPDVIGGTGNNPFKRGKRHDYFTSCLTAPQKGGAIGMPLGTTAPVQVGANLSPIGVPVVGAPGVLGLLNDAGVNNIQRTSSLGGTALTVDLSNAAGTINQLRQAFQLQRMLEKDARGGTRYTEHVRAHFGVTSPDARLQRAEYLGGGSTPVVVSAVAQTAPQQAAGVTTPQGNLAAFGTASFSGGHGFVKSFTEHGFVLGIINVRADLTYQRGLDRLLSITTRSEMYYPSLAHLGEQAVLNKEIWLQDNAASNALAFGYQERYAEYRYKPSRVTGLFRSTAAGTLHMWHLAESFATLPLLNGTFIEDPTSGILARILAVPAEPDFLLDAWFEYKHARPLPVYGVPGLIDHF